MTPEEARELDRSTSLFHGALIALGAQSIIDSLAMWEDVPPVPGVANSGTASRWLRTATTYVAQRRLRARDMALAYYRYQRALATGTTIALPGQEPVERMSLSELKREFEAMMAGPSQEPQEGDLSVPDKQIDVEVIDGLEEALEAEEERAEEIAEENLRILGPQRLETFLGQPALTEGDTVERLDSNRADAHARAGRRQAASLERNVLNGGRGTLFLAADRDRRALGFVRVSKTGTPCGFCAMLISRGPVLKGADREASLYRSNEGTGPKANGEIVTYGDLDLYHDNCHCYAVPVFSLKEFETSDIFALNREYAELWPIVTDGLGGEDALSAWRRFIRQEAKSRKAQEAAA